ncbi:hypothetical protein FRB90_001755 [Tulasnella sp. 427]|nr:hypothetical protein FRB90_001755 [Tulasnella sp. 427]
MSTPDLPTTALTESSSPAIETLPPEPSNTSSAVPSAKYLYGIILVALILFLFICFCTTREVVRRQQRESFPQSSSQSDEEKEPTLEPPRIYDVHLEEPAAHSFHETSEQSLNFHNTKVLSISFVSQAPTTVKSSHISFISAFKRLVADKLGTIKVQIKRRALLQVDAPNLTFDLSSPHTPKPSITLSTVFISMPTPGRPRSHEKRPSFAMSENSGEWTLRESSGHSEEIVFGIHEQSWL